MEKARRSSGGGERRPSQEGMPPPGPEASQASLAESQGGRGSQMGEAEEDEEESFNMSPEELEARLISLLETCTFTVYNYTRRGLFDRDKLIVLSLLTFAILLRSQAVDASEYEALCRGMRNPTPPPITDDLSRWVGGTRVPAFPASCALCYNTTYRVYAPWILS